MREILAGIVDFFEPVAEEASIDLRFHVAEDTTVSGDPNWLHQLFANLVDNAIKFSPADSAVTVSLGRRDDEIAVAVEDGGPGIPEYECERIFEAFHRLDSQKPGSGLGLPLAREIARAHGGDIDLDSELGKGSRFIVRLPTISPEAAGELQRRDAD